MPPPAEGHNPSPETSIALLQRGQDEMVRQIGDMRAENNRQFADLRAELNRTFALKSDLTANEAETKALRREVDRHSEQLGWVVKIMVGAILMSLIGIVLTKGGIVHP